MNANYIESLNEIFEGTSLPSADRLLRLADEIVAFCHTTKEKLNSEDPVQKEAALQETLELKQLIESKLEALCSKTGMNLEELTSLAEDPTNLLPQEQLMAKELKAKFQEFQNKKEKNTNNNN